MYKSEAKLSTEHYQVREGPAPRVDPLGSTIASKNCKQNSVPALTSKAVSIA